MFDFTTCPPATLIVGSAPDAKAVSDVPIPKQIHKIAINNAWRLRPDFDQVIVPGDFPQDRYPPQDYPGEIVQGKHYMNGHRVAGGILFSGGTMSISTGLYAINAIARPIILFVGCNMVYGTGQTHFYGTGSPDPVTYKPATYASIKNLRAKTARMFLFGLMNDRLLLNALPQDGSNLCLPAATDPTILYKAYGRFMASKHMAPILMQTAKLLAHERKFPGPRHSLNLHPIGRDPDMMAFIDAVDAEWLKLGEQAVALCSDYLQVPQPRT